MLEEVPDRVVADLDAAIGQFGKQRSQCHIRLLSQPTQQPIPLISKSIGSPTTYPTRRGATF
jgi:hypothetical protein